MNGKAGFAGGRPSAVAALVAAMTVWGSTFVVTERVLEEVGPFAIAALRFGIGLVSLLPFAYHRGFRLRLALEPTFLLFGLTGVALYYGLQNLAPVYTSAANAPLISAGIPAATALLAFLFIKEQMPRARLFGIALSVFGVLLVDGTVPSGGGSAALLGNALMVVAVLAYGASAVQGRALRAAGGHPASVATAAGFAAGLLFLLPPAAGEALFFDAPDLGPKGWLALAYLGIVASGLTMFLWNYALRHVPASAAALYVNLIPVLGLGFSVLVGGSSARRSWSEER